MVLPVSVDPVEVGNRLNQAGNHRLVHNQIHKQIAAARYPLEMWGSLDVPDHRSLIQQALDDISNFNTHEYTSDAGDEVTRGGILVLPVRPLWVGGRLIHRSNVGIEGIGKTRKRSFDDANWVRMSVLSALPDFPDSELILIHKGCQGYFFRGFALDGNKSHQSGTITDGITVERVKATISVTGVAATNLFTSVGHGLHQGDRVCFGALTGGTGLLLGTKTSNNYYVIASGLTADTFKLSITHDGPEVDFTTDLTSGVSNTWEANFSAPYARYEDLSMKNFTGYGMKTSQSHLGPQIEYVEITDCDAGGALLAAGDGRVNFLTISNCGKGVGGPGAWQVSGTTHINQLIVFKCGVDLRIGGDPDDGYDGAPADVSVENSYLEQSETDGVLLDTGVSDIHFVNVSFSRNSTLGNDQGSHVRVESSDSSLSFGSCRFKDSDTRVTYDFELNGSAVVDLVNNTHKDQWRTARYSNKAKVRTKIAGVSHYSGTAFPAGPATGDHCYRTDRNIEYFYDGTRWLSTTLYSMATPTTGFSATAILLQELLTPESTDKWIENVYVTPLIAAGGTDLDASNNWVGGLFKFGTGGAGTSIGTFATIDSGASGGGYRTPITYAVNALLGLTYSGIRITWTKTGTPGQLTAPVAVTYRLVG